MTAATDLLDGLRGEQEVFKQSMKAKLEETLPKYIEALLQEKKGDIVYWKQYAPAFNDGEPCEFGVHEETILSLSPENFVANVDKAWTAALEYNKLYKLYGNRYGDHTKDLISPEKARSLVSQHDHSLREDSVRLRLNRWVALLEGDAVEDEDVSYHIDGSNRLSLLESGTGTAILSWFPDQMKAMFGESCIVIAYRDEDGKIKFETKEYYHE